MAIGKYIPRASHDVERQQRMDSAAKALVSLTRGLKEEDRVFMEDWVVREKELFQPFFKDKSANQTLLKLLLTLMDVPGLLFMEKQIGMLCSWACM
jgi:hypothetical protein